MKMLGWGPSHNKITVVLNQNEAENSSELLDLLFKHIFHTNTNNNNKQSHKFFVPFSLIGAPLETWASAFTASGSAGISATPLSSTAFRSNVASCAVASGVAFPSSWDAKATVRDNGAPMGGKIDKISYVFVRFYVFL